MIDADIMARPTAASSVSRTTPLSLAPSRRYSIAIAATTALALPGINRQELTLALAEWRVLESDATVRGVLGAVLPEAPRDAEIRRRLNDGDGA